MNNRFYGVSPMYMGEGNHPVQDVPYGIPCRKRATISRSTKNEFILTGILKEEDILSKSDAIISEINRLAVRIRDNYQEGSQYITHVKNIFKLNDEQKIYEKLNEIMDNIFKDVEVNGLKLKHPEIYNLYIEEDDELIRKKILTINREPELIHLYSYLSAKLKDDELKHVLDVLVDIEDEM